MMSVHLNGRQAANFSRDISVMAEAQATGSRRYNPTLRRSARRLVWSIRGLTDPTAGSHTRLEFGVTSVSFFSALLVTMWMKREESDSNKETYSCQRLTSCRRLIPRDQFNSFFFFPERKCQTSPHSSLQLPIVQLSFVFFKCFF